MSPIRLTYSLKKNQPANNNKNKHVEWNNASIFDPCK